MTTDTPKTEKPKPKMPNMPELWADKHAPRTLEEMVFTDAETERLFKSWVETADVPHCLFAGDPGMGKTSSALLLMRLLDVPSENWWLVNASVQGGIDDVREEILRFVRGQSPSGGMKYLILDEADGLSTNAQMGLRGVINEAGAGNTRIIMTANNIRKITPALKSRVKVLVFSKMDREAFMMRAAKVLLAEKIAVDEAGLEWLMTFYPDMRKTLTEARENSRTGSLVVPETSASDAEHEDWHDAIRDYFAGGGLESARKKLVESVAGTAWESVYSWMYRNLDAISADPEKQKIAIRHLAAGLDRLGTIADPELCLSGTLVSIDLEISN